MRLPLPVGVWSRGGSGCCWDLGPDSSGGRCHLERQAGPLTRLDAARSLKASAEALARVEVREQVARARADLLDGLLQATRAALILARSEACTWGSGQAGHSALAAHRVRVGGMQCDLKCSLPGTLTLTARVTWTWPA